MSIDLMSLGNGPQPRVSKVEPFEVFAFRTRTGEVVRKIPLAATPTWEEGLNLMGSWSVSVALDSEYLNKDELSGVVDPWDWSWAICQGQKIWQAGPVLGERYSSGSQTEIYGVGIWQLLADQRQSFKPTRPISSVVATPDADIPFGPGAASSLGTPIPVDQQGLNLRGIVRRLIELALLEPGGSLPIDLPTGGTFTGTSVRDFPGYHFESWGQRLLEITQEVNGPEIQFRPRFTTLDRKFIRFQTALGSPRLVQLGTPWIWRSRMGLVGLPFTLDGVSKVRRFWERGAGQDRNVIVGFAENLNGVTTGPTAGLLPLLEQIGSTHNSTLDANTLTSYAATTVSTRLRGILTLQPEVLINGSDGHGEELGSPALRDVFPGDNAILQVRDHFRLQDGDYPCRIARIRAKSATTATLDVSLL